MADTPSVPFTKKDFLSPLQTAKKFNAAREQVEELMTRLYRTRKTFVLTRPNGNGSNKAEIVIKSSTNGHGMPHDLRLHPMAMKEFEELLRAMPEKASKKDVR